MFVWYIDLNNLNSLAETKKANSILLSSFFHLNTYSSESVCFCLSSFFKICEIIHVLLSHFFFLISVLGCCNAS